MDIYIWRVWKLNKGSQPHQDNRGVICYKMNRTTSLLNTMLTVKKPFSLISEFRNEFWIKRIQIRRDFIRLPFSHFS